MKKLLLFFLFLSVGVVSHAKKSTVPAIDKDLQKKIELAVERACGIAPSRSEEVSEFCKIILMTVASAISYGIAHDQVTVRICRDYFCGNQPEIAHHKQLLLDLAATVHPFFHPATIPDTAVAVVWGIQATWFMGLIVGFELAMVARFGDKFPKLSYKELFKPLMLSLLAMAGVSLVAGCVGYANYVPGDRYTPAFWCDAYAHEAGYATAAVIALIAPAWVIYKRACKYQKNLVSSIQ